MIETVLSLLNEKPIEDGISHPAESYIEEELESGSDVRELYSWCYKNLRSDCSSRLTGVLRCIGRLEKKVAGEEGGKLMLEALKNSDVGVREAAIRAFERWGGHDSIDILKKYVKFEPVNWLIDYASKVIEDPQYA